MQEEYKSITCSCLTFVIFLTNCSESPPALLQELARAFSCTYAAV